jgi:hypothetical protein
MPLYNNSPFAAAVKLLYAGVAEYLFGSWAQDKSPTKMYVTSVAIAANVATLGVSVYEGDVPAVGSLISVQGTQSGAGEFNVTNVALASVALNSAGVGTVTFALVGANLATTPDAGISIVPQPVKLEAIAAGASIPVATSNNSFGGDLDVTVTAYAIFGALPTAVTVSLQGAMVNLDSAFVTLGTIATVAASATTANGFTTEANYLFYRALVSGLNGAGTIAVLIAA